MQVCFDAFACALFAVIAFRQHRALSLIFGQERLRRASPTRIAILRVMAGIVALGVLGMLCSDLWTNAAAH